MTIYPWLAAVLALVGGAVLAGTAAVRKHVIELHHRWVHVDELTGRPVDPHDEAAGHMDVPLGSSTVKLRLTGNLQNAWTLLSSREQESLAAAQQKGVLLTLGAVTAAVIFVVLTPPGHRLVAGGLSGLFFLSGYIIWTKMAGSFSASSFPEPLPQHHREPAAGPGSAAEETK